MFIHYANFAKKILFVFVQINSVKAVKSYFKERLKDFFSESEIKFIVKEAVVSRLGLSSSEYLLSDEHLLSESDLLYFRSIVKRLQKNEPFQYILGRTEFFGLEIKTDKRALIPRPETEELVEWITAYFPKDKELHMLDMCTGSGCIALALKSHFITSTITATDISSEALHLAEENTVQLELPLSLLQLDATKTEFSNLQKKFYDCWVSNPPYIPISDKQNMAENVLEYEPHIALFVENDDPLLFYRTIGESALQHLKKGGLLFFELHEDLADSSVELMKELGFINLELKKDLQGKDRMLKVENPY